MQIHTYTGSYNLSRRPGGVRYIIVHYTGSGSSKAGSALANCKYFSGGNRNASADFFIDDSGVWKYNPDLSRYYTWAVGDGHGRYGITNANSVSIEVCNNGGPFTGTQIAYLSQLVRELMMQFGVPASRVVRHYDASRKCCPLPYSPNGEDPTGSKWASLHARITSGAGSAESEDDLPTPSDVWAFTNGGNQIDTTPGTAWTNLMDTNMRIQDIQSVLGSDGQHDVLANVVDTNLRIQELQTTITALTEAIRTLASAQGADPEAVAKAVSDAVAAKLSEIKLSVTTDGQAQP